MSTVALLFHEEQSVSVLMNDFHVATLLLLMFTSSSFRLFNNSRDFLDVIE